MSSGCSGFRRHFDAKLLRWRTGPDLLRVPRISASFLIEVVEYEGCRATLFLLPYFGTPPYECARDLLPGECSTDLAKAIKKTQRMQPMIANT